MRNSATACTWAAVVFLALDGLPEGDAWADDPGGVAPALRSQDLRVDVPEILRRDLCERAARLASAAYPQADANVFRRNFEKNLAKQRWLVQAFSGAEGLNVYFEGPPIVEINFPSADWTDLRALGGPPPGVSLPKLPARLAVAETQRVARETLGRVLERAADAEKYQLVESGDTFNWLGEGRAHYFTWGERLPSTLPHAGKRVRIEVHPQYGVIQRIHVREPVGTPKVPYKQIVKDAADAIKGFDPKYLTLRRAYWLGKSRLAWHYQLPPLPRGWFRDWTMWDADTGEVLFSQVLHGGTEKNSYRNPSFYVELTEESKKQSVEELIKQRVGQLEALGRMKQE